MSRTSLYSFYNLYIPINNLIIQASDKSGNSQNMEVNYPIGMSFNFLNLKESDKYRIQVGKHENLVLSSFSTNTDWNRRMGSKVNRKIIHNNLYKNGIKNYKLNFVDYIFGLSKFKFIISPEGNGEDCHRHYESLLAGCIPIIEYNDKILKKYEGLPVLYTKDYSEITPEYLIRMYKKMIFKKYNFKKLYLSFYNKENIDEIKDKGNFWCEKIINKKAY
tara:strand:- start:151 stop:807 length:657 start_codon:yes stop_codon:yes gene_type:complete